ncbi:MAG: branched-chain amino acid ABC transporter permease [Parasporobacterium sp.]|nr:branched-chain amino acid ABC transporter permease [Parasporobacterium sp.]
MIIAIDGLSLGAIYALIALGYTMVYGIAKMLNFAHGDIIMVGAYMIYTICTFTLNIGSLPLWVCAVISFVVAMIVSTVLGIVIEKVAYKPLRGASPLAALITAIGVSYLLQGVAQLIWGADQRTVSILDKLGNVRIGEYLIKWSSIITLVLGAIIMIALTLFVKKSRTGRAMLAVSEDKGAAQMMGINVNKIISITFAIGSALATFAAIFYLPKTALSPTLGSMPGIKAFAAAVIGGIGSIPGAMLGGVLLGVVEVVCNSIPGLSSFTTAIEFALLIVILMVRPIGLLGKKRRVKV